MPEEDLLFEVTLVQNNMSSLSLFYVLSVSLPVWIRLP
jgi:hypothetical protein